MDIAMNIYNFVVEVIGPVPIEMEFLYAFGVIVVLGITIMAVYFPYYLIYKIWGD